MSRLALGGYSGQEVGCKIVQKKSRVKIKITHVCLYLISFALFLSNHMCNVFFIHLLSIDRALFKATEIQWSLSKGIHSQTGELPGLVERNEEERTGNN